MHSVHQDHDAIGRERLTSVNHCPLRKPYPQLAPLSSLPFPLSLSLVHTVPPPVNTPSKACGAPAPQVTVSGCSRRVTSRSASSISARKGTAATLPTPADDEKEDRDDARITAALSVATASIVAAAAYRFISPHDPSQAPPLDLGAGALELALADLRSQQVGHLTLVFCRPARRQPS